MLKKLDLKNGKITHNDLKDINPNLDFSKQIFSLKEDLLQISYDNTDKYTIDVGWRPELDPSGEFIIYVIKNFNWEEPLLKKKTKKIQHLKQILIDAIALVDKSLKRRTSNKAISK